MGGFFLDIFIGYFLRVIRNEWRAFGSKKWPCADALVTSDSIESSGYGGSKVEVVYSYRFQDELYTGMHTEPCLGSGIEFVERFPQGRRFIVRVNPDAPQVSVVLDDDQKDGILKQLEGIRTK